MLQLVLRANLSLGMHFKFHYPRRSRVAPFGLEHVHCTAELVSIYRWCGAISRFGFKLKKGEYGSNDAELEKLVNENDVFHKYLLSQ